jgi:hypothetical protein
MKISALSIIVLGLAIGLVVLSYGFFEKWVPNTTEAQYQRDYQQQLITEINKTKQAEQNFVQAEKMRDEKAAEWQAVVAAKTPPLGLPNGINLSVDPWQLAIDAPKFRDSAQRQINAQLKVGGVKVISGPEVPAPEPNSTALLASYFNTATFGYPIVIWELGQVTVSGTYKQITANVRAWSHMKGFLAVTDGLAITGTDTPLTGTYNLVVVGYLKGSNFFGGVNEPAVAASTAATGGGLAGMGGTKKGPMMPASMGGGTGMPPGMAGGAGGRPSMPGGAGGLPTLPGARGPGSDDK